ncbi:YcaO-like family protein [Virgisporangium ochraceum]|uniref:YcaO domain-containing protein n=1 Tax=Virgisporangium ochraceum TaxID=65505 RepID=A0A8J4A014_9ACTN|nr:YcaO-like family protein [Virgisporangium ochraceum]GIJ72691.1 hypothetical protein Voc01_076080 [Virgisporangium ochraceum]
MERTVLDGVPVYDRHRCRTPAETFRQIEPILKRVGVTRIADVTWLDDVGIPVCQAIRPNARTLSVSQGKGMTTLHSVVSACMEALEVWHSEELGPAETVAPVREMEDRMSCPLSALRLADRHLLHPGTTLEWSPASVLGTTEETMVPTALLRMDSTVRPMWSVPLFEVTSNGLASGNTYGEAVLHGLYEVVERDAMARAGGGGVRVRSGSIDGPATELLDRFRRAGVGVEVDLATSPTGVVCFVARVFSEDFPVEFCGSAAHGDPDLALCRALTEAAQSRVAAIAGTREDIGQTVHRRTRAPSRRDAPAASVELTEVRNGVPAEFGAAATTEAAVGLLVDRVTASTGLRPLAVDLTRPDIGIPVVRILAPRLTCPDGY